MTDKQKYSPDLDALTGEELSLLQKLSHSIRKFVAKSPEISNTNYATRDAHATTYSLLKGSFQVYEEFKGKSVFPDGKLDCIIRISHAHLKIISQKKTIPGYGFSVKIFDGEKTVANFPLVNFPLFPFINVSKFLKIFISINNYFTGNLFQKVSNSVGILKNIVGAVPNMMNFSFQKQVFKLLKNWHRFILAFDYHSIGVYRMGDDLIKIKLVPINVTQKKQNQNIHLSIEDYLKKNIYEMDFCIQYCYNLKDQPVNALNKMWKKSEFVPVGNIQMTEILDSKSLENELLSFNPFDNIPELQPVGRIQQLRNAAYSASFETRKNINLNKK